MGARSYLTRLVLSGSHHDPPKAVDSPTGILEAPKEVEVKDPDPELKKYKRLFHQLHNLEDNPNVLAEARDTLILFFAESLSGAIARPKDDAIVSMEEFDAESLAAFLQRQDEKILTRLERYTTRRESGGSRELFQTPDEARRWLIQRAPSKLVDGAWLGYMHTTETPFALRPITKNAWQVMSEELGDGDLAKNHAAIYRKLLQGIGAGLPEASSEAFVRAHDDDNNNNNNNNTKNGSEDIEIWRSAVAQMLISLFPREFLPEILGFNLHFECLAWDTVRAARELREVRLDDYYFLLHISIDNSDSGHAAMASRVVVDYLRRVQSEQGDAALRRAWGGVQAGYLLSESATLERAPPPEGSGGSSSSSSLVPFVGNAFAGELVRIFRAKAAVAARLHCASRVRIGPKKLAEWLDLDQAVLDTAEGRAEFLSCLSTARPWVRVGDVAGSRLVAELEWNGKMFGAFTANELEVLKGWIVALARPPPVDTSVYWDFVGQPAVPSAQALQARDVRLDGNVFSDRGLSSPWSPVGLAHARTAGTLGRTVDPVKFLPLWFAHPCLLERLAAIPIRTCDIFGSAVVRLIRAQRGFTSEGTGVSGMDGLRTSGEESLGLVELGLEMSRSAGLPTPRDLRDVVSADFGFALDMLHWSMRPVRNRNALFGMALAFVEVHESIASDGRGLLSELSMQTLGVIARRERQCLAACRQVMTTKKSIDEAEAAAELARAAIACCFS
ncbi:hypothetical protein Daus18300_011413 [Diaporthe australafricana]|uniref:Uncharacterized protein n=1 Tax=Diaporthe australafricana TaxID=127596 RepID=A0ABR3W6Y2_9PEZI